jgi:lipopolysaccharide export system protein LptA
MMRNGLRAAVFLAGVALGAGAGLAAGPVDVEANTMEIIDANKQAIFKGSVVASRTGETMKADEMVVDYAEEKQKDGSSKTEVSTLNAKGNVTIVTKTQTVTGDAAIMDVKANKLVVTGNVTVVQGKTILTGQKMNVDLDTNRTLMTSTPGGRVRGRFVPK